MADIPAGALSAEQYQQLASYGVDVQPAGGGPVAALQASMPGASGAELLQAAAATPGLALGVAQRFVPNAGALTFENPFRHRINEAFVVGAFEVLSGFGGAPFGSQSPRQLTWQDPQVNFPRGLDRIYVPGTEPPPSNRLPVPYEPPPGNVGPWWGFGGIGAILTGVIAGMWEGWPNELGPELGPFDTTAGGRNPIPGQGIPYPRAQGPDPSVFGPPSPEQGPPIPTDYEPPPVPAPQPYDFGDAHDRAKKAMEDQLIKDMTTPAPVPPPPAPTAAPAPKWQRWVWPAIGALGAIQLGRVGRSRSSQTLPDISVISQPGLTAADVAAIVEPLLSSQQLASSSTMPQAATGGVWDMDSSSDGCNCRKKSGKKRRCLARAQLTWRSGPKKGRAAGSRCYRFAD